MNIDLFSIFAYIFFNLHYMPKRMWTHLVILMSMILEYNVQQSHMGGMFGCPRTFGHSRNLA